MARCCSRTASTPAPCPAGCCAIPTTRPTTRRTAASSPHPSLPRLRGRVLFRPRLAPSPASGGGLGWGLAPLPHRSALRLDRWRPRRDHRRGHLGRGLRLIPAQIGDDAGGAIRLPCLADMATV